MFSVPGARYLGLGERGRGGLFYTHPGTAHGALVFSVGRVPFWEHPFSSCSTNSPPRRFRRAHMFRKHCSGEWSEHSMNQGGSEQSSTIL
jgi:hypothetical protein